MSWSNVANGEIADSYAPKAQSKTMLNCGGVVQQSIADYTFAWIEAL